MKEMMMLGAQMAKQEPLDKERQAAVRIKTKQNLRRMSLPKFTIGH